MTEVPPPGALLVTETLRAPNAAFASIVIFAVICVVLLTVVEFTVMSAPKLTELTPLIKFVPVNTTSSVCKRLPLVGARLAKVGTGLFMVNAGLLDIPPPGTGLVTKKFRAPVAAPAVIVKLAVKLVELFTVIELTVNSPNSSFTPVMPLIKFVPVKITSSVCKRLPLAGAMLVTVGAGLFTVNV